MENNYKDIKMSCLRPRRVRNKYTGEFFTVGCGTCKACLMRLSNRAAYMCDLQENDYKYCMFVTLTYDNKNVPLLQVQECNSSASVDYVPELSDDSYLHYDLYDVTERFESKLNVFGSKVAECDVHPFVMSQLHRKFKYFGNRIPYLCKYDAQCFLKRLRKNLKLYTDDKINYYLVGEYGPVHFRPHFHALFYFDSEKILQIFGKVLHKSWQNGFVDYSLSRSKCSSYVAKYVNCRNSVPRVFSDRALRPFAIHSQGFAQGFYKSKKKEIYENAPQSFDVILRTVGDDVSKTYPWRSLVALFFPKCRRFNSLSHNALVYSYRLLPTAKKFYKFDTIADLSNQVLNDLMFKDYDYRDLFKSDYSLSSSSKDCFLQYIYILLYDNDFMERIKDFDYCITNCDMITLKRMRQSISQMFYVSNHFIEFCNDGRSDYKSVSNTVTLIERFYSYQDYKNLCNMYDEQSSVITDSDMLSYLYFWYDNVFERVDDDDLHYFVLNDYDVHLYSALCNSPFYQSFLHKVNEHWIKSVKHKVLNDKNEIFCNSKYND